MSSSVLKLVLAVLLLAAPVSAQTWPARVQEIVDTLAAQNSDLTDRTSDEKRRELTRMFAEQAEFEFGNFGTKRYGGGPPSADSLCMRTPFVCWDWSIPSGIARFPGGLDLGGDPNQIFIAVTAVNHLGIGLEPPPPDPAPPPPPPVLAEQLDRIEQKLDAHIAQEEAHWQAAKGKWERATKTVLKFGGKWIAPIVGGILAGVIGS